jgi:hypothetical protein
VIGIQLIILFHSVASFKCLYHHHSSFQTSMPPRTSTQQKASSKRGKPKVNFGANGRSRKRKASPVVDSDPEPSSPPKRPRNDKAPGSTAGPSISTSTGTTDTGAGSDNANASTDAGVNTTSTKTTPPKTRARNRFGIRASEVPPHAKTTQVCHHLCALSCPTANKIVDSIPALYLRNLGCPQTVGRAPFRH